MNKSETKSTNGGASDADIILQALVVAESVMSNIAHDDADAKLIAAAREAAQRIPSPDKPSDKFVLRGDAYCLPHVDQLLVAAAKAVQREVELYSPVSESRDVSLHNARLRALRDCVESCELQNIVAMRSCPTLDD